jgi:REP element-mobilizing transposase RayT
VNFKYRTTIRNKQTLKLLKRAIHNARLQGLKIIHYSLQTNHIHLIIEADSNLTLSQGMRSLTITMAKGLKMGSVQIARYHLHVLRTIKLTRTVVHYVLFNQQRHDRKKISEVNDYCSLLSLGHAVKLCQDYAEKHKIRLRINPGEKWLGDPAESYLLRCALGP